MDAPELGNGKDAVTEATGGNGGRGKIERELWRRQRFYDLRGVINDAVFDWEKHEEEPSVTQLANKSYEQRDRRTN